MCSGNCVLVENDNQHCGACKMACSANQHCAEGECLDCNRESRVYAACLQTGHVAVLSSATRSQVELALVGAGPQALSGKGEVLLCADYGAEQLLRMNAQNLQPLGETDSRVAVSTGKNPIHLSVYGSHIYVVNADSNTLQIVDTRNKANGPWETVGELYFGPNTVPQALAIVGNQGFVPLFGDLANGETDAGQRLVRVSLSNPAAPTLSGEADFTRLDLQPYPGKEPLPLPYDVVAHQGALYVALNNLDKESLHPAGPGMIAKVDAKTLSSSTLSLGDNCRNVTSLASNGRLLVASCAGDYVGTPGITGLALLEGDKVKDMWAAPPGFTPGALAFKCDELWVGNAADGDVYLFSTFGQKLRLLRGEGGAEGGPIETCPPSGGWTSVQALWLKPKPKP